MAGWLTTGALNQKHCQLAFCCAIENTLKPNGSAMLGVTAEICCLNEALHQAGHLFRHKLHNIEVLTLLLTS
jgi:hypothetical protein